MRFVTELLKNWMATVTNLPCKLCLSWAEQLRSVLYIKLFSLQMQTIQDS